MLESAENVCSSKETCIYERNCCPSYLENNWKYLISNKNSNSKDFCKTFVYSYFGNYGRTFSYVSYPLVSYCHQNFSGDSLTKQKCESSLNETLMGRDDFMYAIDPHDLQLYKNKHCAICNNIITYELLENTLICESREIDEAIASKYLTKSHKDKLIENKCFPFLNKDMIACSLNNTLDHKENIIVREWGSKF